MCEKITFFTLSHQVLLATLAVTNQYCHINNRGYTQAYMYDSTCHSHRQLQSEI